MVMRQQTSWHEFLSAAPRSSRPPGDKVTNSLTGPFTQRTSYVAQRVASGDWREGSIPAAEAGLTRELPIFLADRRSDPIVHHWHGDKNTFCPPLYWDRTDRIRCYLKA
jgi:hypothetical protein